MEAMYGRLAGYYDLLYSFKDYRRESRYLVELAERYGRSGGTEWLDVACGTGQHLRHLARQYRCVGVDLSPQMLAIARRRLPRIPLIQADMRTFSIGRRFDVVSCLFSAIGHVQTYAGLRRALVAMRRHLKPGGVLLIEPWIPPDGFRPGNVALQTYAGVEIQIARASFSELHGGRSLIRMHYLIARRGRGVEHYVLTSRSGLFSRARTLDLMRSVGLAARFRARGLTPGRGLFIGVAPGPSR